MTNYEATSHGLSQISKHRRIGYTPKWYVDICEWGREIIPFIFAERVFVLFADEGIYNTYILDTDYESWALIMHCAEKTGSTRYLSALLLSRERELGMNVINYLRWQFSDNFKWFSSIHSVQMSGFFVAGRNYRSTTSICRSCFQSRKKIVIIENKPRCLSHSRRRETMNDDSIRSFFYYVVKWSKTFCMVFENISEKSG